MVPDIPRHGLVAASPRRRVAPTRPRGLVVVGKPHGLSCPAQDGAAVAEIGNDHVGVVSGSGIGRRAR